MTDLQDCILGRTGLGVTRLGYGSMELRHTNTPLRPHLDRSTAGALLNDVLDGGINYIDTSPTYGPAEELIGEFLSARREEFSLATKTGFVVDELPARRHLFTRDVIRRGLEWSLRRLNTDYVDVVQLPGSPTSAELLEFGALEELEALRAEGKCRFLGISGWEPNLSEHIESGAFDVFQIPYSALERENESLIGRAVARGFGTVIRGGVAQGRLSAGPAPEATPEARDRVISQRDGWMRAGLDELLEGGTRGDFMIRYLMSNRDVQTAIIGTSDRTHLQENLAAAARGPLSRDIYARAKEQLSSV